MSWLGSGVLDYAAVFHGQHALMPAVSPAMVSVVTQAEN